MAATRLQSLLLGLLLSLPWTGCSFQDFGSLSNGHPRSGGLGGHGGVTTGRAGTVAGSTGEGGSVSGEGGVGVEGENPETGGNGENGGTSATGGVGHGSSTPGKLTLSAAPPTPGPNDVYYFTGAANDGNNVSDGQEAYADGCSNDAFTYVAPDRRNQGQTFRTGGSTAGYSITAVWVQHAGYTANTSDGNCSNGTWNSMGAGAIYKLRLTDPTKAGTAGFPLTTATFTTTGTEGWPPSSSGSANGDGKWVRFTLGAPVAVSGLTTYGFDLSSNGNSFFEWLGSKDGTFAGGSAYQGKTTGQSGGPDNVMTTLSGDRVFLVQMTVVCEPQDGSAGAARQDCPANGGTSAGGGADAGGSADDAGNAL